jgi:hypothetical protein
MLGQHGADRLDAPPQTTSSRRFWRSLIELGREGSRRRPSNRVGSLQLSVLRLEPPQLRGLLGRGPSRLPASTTTRRTHLGTVSAVPISSSSANFDHHRPLQIVIGTDFTDHPHGPLPLFRREPPCCVPWHDPSFFKDPSPWTRPRGSDPRRSSVWDRREVPDSQHVRAPSVTGRLPLTLASVERD